MKHLRANLVLLVGTLVLTTVLYPLALLAVGQTVFPTTANGSLVRDADGNVRGSHLIAQEFKGDRWFRPRPSAAGYNAAASGASNFGASNPKLRERVEEQLKADYLGATAVPADAVTASGSGLDPHLTLRAAKLQVDRVAAAWGTTHDQVEAILDAQAFRPLLGVCGDEALVNVLEVNRELARRFQR